MYRQRCTVLVRTTFLWTVNYTLHTIQCNVDTNTTGQGLSLPLSLSPSLSLPLSLSTLDKLTVSMCRYNWMFNYNVHTTYQSIRDIVYQSSKSHVVPRSFPAWASWNVYFRTVYRQLFYWHPEYHCRFSFRVQSTSNLEKAAQSLHRYGQFSY